MPYPSINLQVTRLLAAVIFAWSAAAAAQLPPEYHASYTIAAPGPNASVKWQLAHTEDGRLLIQRDLRWLIIRVKETSTLVLKDGKLRPLLYTYRSLGRRRQIQFDWTTGQVHSEKRQGRRTLPLRPGLLDPLGYSLQQRLDLEAHGPDWPGGSYQLISRSKIRTVKIKNAGMEKVSTPAGDFSALRIEQLTPDGREQERGIAWHVPELDYLPVRIQWREDGKSYNGLLKALTGTGTALPATRGRAPPANHP